MLLASCCAFYGLFGGGVLVYLWNCRTPIVASVRRIHVPPVDKGAVWSLSSGGDVGVI